MLGLAVIPLLTLGAFQDPAGPFERGQELIADGDPEAALQYWVTVRDSLAAAGAQDPRIATAFVAAVAEHDWLSQYAAVASQIFYWGFSIEVPGEEVREEILAEAARTFALTDSSVAKYWAEEGQNDPRSLALAIKNFWIEQDPTPTTAENERLLEHWRRIVYARQNYVYNHSSPYETDDRGLYYVKYGRPDRITRGTLGMSGSERRAWGISPEFESQFDRRPQYEVWRYARPLQRSEFTYFLFGNTDGTGPFESVAGLHEIIPRNARTSPFARHRGIRAQHYLELFYYEDLARMGGPFGRRYDELDRLWNRARAPNEGTLDATSQRYTMADEVEYRRPRPPFWSPVSDAPRSALSAQVARVIDGVEPHVRVFAVSSPLWRPVLADDSSPESIELAAYEAMHTAIVRDELLDEVGRVGMVPADRQENVSSVVLKHAPEVKHIAVVAEHVIASGQQQSDDFARVYPGTAYFDVGPPLRRRPDEFEVSDLIVGIAPRPEFPLDDAPVPLLPATQFWREDLLRVYFEVYRDAATPPDDLGTFDVRVQIVPLEAAGPGPRQPARDEDRATVAVSLEFEGATKEQFFDLDLRNESPGFLRIVLEITDEETGATRTRVTPIRLLEN